MINYSIVNRTVNTNLLEINQAKARIAKAKLAGQTPDPADVELANTPMLYRAYAVAQYSDIMTIEKFAKHISEHGCVYSRADIAAILYMTVDCMREQLLEGKKIRLGDLGDFYVSLVSKGVESADKFNAGTHITAVNVNWDCGQEFKNLIADAEFNLVASRSAQAAVIKAIKAGEKVVDLNAKSEGEKTDGSDPSNPSDPSDPGTQDTSPRKFTINVTSANTAQGTVSGGGTYNEGDSVTISATPKAGYQFEKWSDGVTTASRTVSVSQDLDLTATFKAVEQSGGGGGASSL